MDILLPSLLGLHCILGPAGVLSNLNLVESLADHGNVDILSMVPSLVDELGETPDVLANSSRRSLSVHLAVRIFFLQLPFSRSQY